MPAYFLDALRNDLPADNAVRYYANATDGDKAMVSYAFITQVPSSASTVYGDPRPTFRQLDSAAQELVEKAMSLISAVANVSFVETLNEAAANLLVGSWDMPNWAGYATYPVWSQWHDGLATQGELMLSVADYGVGNLSVILHELCHGLGLKHPHDGGSKLPEEEDIRANTVMSYNYDWSPAQLGVFDVIALQSIYGPAAQRMGNSTYVLGRDKVIWDGGGHDLIDASGATKGVTLWLEHGNWSHVGEKSGSFLSSGQVWLGHFSTIEDARGSRHADRIFGNAQPNSLSGGAGNDRLLGSGGADRLLGNDGADSLDGGRGGDLLSGGAGSDRIEGGADGKDRLYGDSGNDTLRGGNGADKLSGGSGADTLSGGGDSDRFIFTSRGEAGRGSARDTIVDLSSSDRIDISALDLDFRGHRNFTGSGDELRASIGSDYIILCADFNGDRRTDFEILVRGVSGFDRDQLIL